MLAPEPGRVSAEGLVIRTESGFHRVLVDGRVVVCRAPKKILARERTTTTAVVIGDRVRMRSLDDGSGVVEEILPRENELVRGATGGSKYLDVIAANLDQLVVVHSFKEPDLMTARLDRFLLIAEAAEIPAIVCLNKTDLASDDESETAAEMYRLAGYPVLLTSASRMTGVDELRDVLSEHVSALVGPSGVGKSSLLNDVQPGLRLRTGEVSDATGMGRHTTTTAELLALTGGGWVADTPGLGELAIRDVEAEDLAWLFPEMRVYMIECRFTNCTHRTELGCAVRAAVGAANINPQRYGTYLRVYDLLLEQRQF